jgi:iron complex outermembrane receptor protein
MRRRSVGLCNWLAAAGRITRQKKQKCGGVCAQHRIRERDVRKIKAMLLLTGACSFWAPMAHAQSSGEAQDIADEGGAQLAEIVVTAQRREERLQDVPIAVTAIDGESVLQRGVADTQSLTDLVPALQIARQNNSALPFLRGVGSNNGVVGNESSVSVYVDGVYRPSLTAAIFGLSSVERVEVLKGPQGTLFGRNATGGVVHVVTREPDDTPRLDLALGYGNYDTIDLNVFANAPITSNLAMNIAVYGHDQSDGWGRNLATGGDAFTTNEWSVRSRLQWRGPSTKIGLNYSYNYVRSDLGSVGVPVGSTVLFSGSRNAGFYNVYNGAPAEFSRRNGHVADLNVEQELGSLSLVSITSYQRDRSFLAVSQDQSELKLLSGEVNQRERTWTQELQLQSSASAKFRWILGAFYFNGLAAYAPFQISGPVLAAPPPRGPGLPFQRIDSSQNTESIAAFAQATVTILPDTNLTVGARYTYDTHDFSGTLSTQAGLPGYPPSGILLSRAAKSSVGEPTWRLAIDHNFSPDVMAYASYNRGFKSGQFNLSRPQDPDVDPETLDAYEIGAKTELFDRRLRLNASAFYYDYKDIQVQLVNGTNILFLNAARARIKGFDLDFAAQITSEFRIQGALAYTDGRYRNFANAPFYSPNAPFPGNTQFTGDASGNRTIQTPPFAANIGATYTFASEIGTFDLASNYSFNSGYSFHPDNRLQQPVHHLVSASLGWKSVNGRFGLTLWARNLLDEEYFYSVTELTTGDFGVPAAPRTFGVRAQVSF